MGVIRGERGSPEDVIASPSRDAIFSDLLGLDETFRNVLSYLAPGSFSAGEYLWLRGRFGPAPSPLSEASRAVFLTLLFMLRRSVKKDGRFTAAYLDHVRPAFLPVGGPPSSGDQVLDTLVKTLSRLMAAAALVRPWPATRGEDGDYLEGRGAGIKRDAHYVSLVLQRAAGYWHAITTDEVRRRESNPFWKDARERASSVAFHLTRIDEALRASLGAAAPGTYYDGWFRISADQDEEPDDESDPELAQAFRWVHGEPLSSHLLSLDLTTLEASMLQAGLPTLDQRDVHRDAVRLERHRVEGSIWTWAPHHPDDPPSDSDREHSDSGYDWTWFDVVTVEHGRGVPTKQQTTPLDFYFERFGHYSSRVAPRADAHKATLLLNHTIGYYLGVKSLFEDLGS